MRFSLYSHAYNAATYSKFMILRIRPKKNPKSGRGEKGEITLILHLSFVKTGLVEEQGKLHLRRLFPFIINDIHAGLAVQQVILIKVPNFGASACAWNVTVCYHIWPNQDLGY